MRVRQLQDKMPGFCIAILLEWCLFRGKIYHIIQNCIFEKTALDKCGKVSYT